MRTRLGTVRALPSGARAVVPSRGSGQRGRRNHVKPLLAWAGIAGRMHRPDSWRSTSSSWMRSRRPASNVGPVSGKDRLHNNHVLVDQTQICQRQGERHATHEQALAWLPRAAEPHAPSCLAPARHSNRPRSACSTRHASSSARWSRRTGSPTHRSSQATCPWLAAATPTPSSRRSPGRIAGHRLVPSQRSIAHRLLVGGSPAS